MLIIHQHLKLGKRGWEGDEGGGGEEGGCWVGQLGTFSNADFYDGDCDRKSDLFPIDVLHFPSSFSADVKTARFTLTLSTKREYIVCFHVLNIHYFFPIRSPKVSTRTRQYIIGI